MTEDRWRTSTDARLLFQWLARPEGDRKSLLWVAACGRSIWPLLPGEGSRRAIEWLERHTDKPIQFDDEWRTLEWSAEGNVFRFDFMEEMRDEDPAYYEQTVEWIRAADEIPLDLLQSLAGWSGCGDRFDGRTVLREAANFADWCMAGYCGGSEYSWERNISDPKARFLNPHLLRCIFGNPFQPVAFADSWRSETVVALAAGIYAERAFDRLPILADALEEAGCDHPDVLAHCRGPGPHARGCWVVDLV
ncbi:MAG: hypothetical protein ABGY75_21700, partial [Gemmataceae bacterium]